VIRSVTIGLEGVSIPVVTGRATRGVGGRWTRGVGAVPLGLPLEPVVPRGMVLLGMVAEVVVVALASGTLPLELVVAAEAVSLPLVVASFPPLVLTTFEEEVLMVIPSLPVVVVPRGSACRRMEPWAVPKKSSSGTSTERTGGSRLSAMYGTSSKEFGSTHKFAKPLLLAAVASPKHSVCPPHLGTTARPESFSSGSPSTSPVRIWLTYTEVLPGKTVAQASSIFCSWISHS
jgi:hypothetical protein